MIDETEALKKNNQLEAFHKIVSFMSEKLTTWSRPERWAILPDLPPKEIHLNLSEKEMNIESPLSLVNTFTSYALPDFKILLIGSIMHNLIMIIGKTLLIRDQTVSGVAYILMLIIVGLSVGSFFVSLYTLFFNKKLFAKPTFHHYRFASHLFLLGLLILSFSIMPKVSIFLKVLVFRMLSLVPLVESRYDWASTLFNFVADCGLILSTLLADSSISTTANTLVAGLSMLFLCCFVSFALVSGINTRNKRGLKLLSTLCEVMLRQVLGYFHLGDLPKFTLVVDQDAKGNLKQIKKKVKHINIRERGIAKHNFLDEVDHNNKGSIFQRSTLRQQDHSFE